MLRITNSGFVGNSACINACGHGVYAGAAIALRRIKRCTFRDAKIGHHINSRARQGIIRDSRIEDGPNGTASYLINIPNGGNVLVQGTCCKRVANSSNPGVAIFIGAKGVIDATNVIIVRDNVFRSDIAGRTVFVRYRSSAPVEVVCKKSGGNAVPMEPPLPLAAP